jgi:hypothetical protein
MEGGALFNSGFLGASFNWWIGQIADDQLGVIIFYLESLKLQIKFLDGVEDIRFVL